jgi:hypothetical protein
LNLLKGLGAKQIVHRLLSSAPFFVLALAAIFAEPSGQGNRDIFWAVNAFFQNPLNALLGFIAVLSYFALWWWSSLTNQDSRKLTQRGLVDFSAQLDAAQRSLRSAASEAEFADQLEALEVALKQLHDWMTTNMSEAAWQRMISPNRQAASWSYSGQGASDPNFHNHRDNVLSLNQARIGILDEMIKCDAWDK